MGTAEVPCLLNIGVQRRRRQLQVLFFDSLNTHIPESHICHPRRIRLLSVHTAVDRFLSGRPQRFRIELAAHQNLGMFPDDVLALSASQPRTDHPGKILSEVIDQHAALRSGNRDRPEELMRPDRHAILRRYLGMNADFFQGGISP